MRRITPYGLFRGTVATGALLLAVGVIVLLLPLLVFGFLLFCASCALYFESPDQFLGRIGDLVSDILASMKGGLRAYVRVLKGSV